MQVEHRKKPKNSFKEWRCGGCNKLLGIIYPTKTLAIKYKDLTAYIDGEIKFICTFCKSENTYRNTSNIEQISV